MVELFIQRFIIIILFLYKIYPKDEMNLIQNNFDIKIYYGDDY